MESGSKRISLLLEANLRFLLANLQQNSIILKSLNNSQRIQENQSLLNNLLEWLKSLDEADILSQGDKMIVETLKESVKKAQLFEFSSNENKQSLDISKGSSQNIANNEEKLGDSEIPLSGLSSEGKIIKANESNSSGELVSSQFEDEIKSEQKGDETTFFYRMNSEEDRWDYLNSIQTFITSYEHLMHLFIPNVVFEVVKELHRYDCQNKLIINEVISYPSVLIQNLITKFLREAPGSNLFRRIRRIKLDNEIEISFEQSVNISERKSIKHFVESYFDTLTKFLEADNATGLEIFAEKVKTSFKQFSLGPATVEMRLTAVIKHVTESAFNDAENALQNVNASLKTKVIYLATTQLMCDFQNFLLNEPRILKFLEDLKS